MKVALVHFWLVNMRGGERVLEALCRMYPQADIFTHVYDPAEISETIKAHKITTTFIQRLPRANRWYKAYLPLMPLALEQLDLSDYDLVISSESGPAKGVVAAPDAAHVCYCHSPMRYVWDMYPQYARRKNVFIRALMAPLIHYLKIWDRGTAAGVDAFAANSAFIARRIERCWRREAEVIPPPVAVDDFTVGPTEQREDFYLLFGQLVDYKRADLAVRAFSSPAGRKRRLVVIGEGEQMALLQKLAGPNVTLLGRQPFAAVKDHLSRCRALIFPGLEDFGIVPVEALACGAPVIAYGRGGVLDSMEDGVTGVFFEDQTEDALLAALERFEGLSFDPAQLADRARYYHPDRFVERMAALVDKTLAAKK